MAYDVIIIGSGLGGLLCGAILSKEGMNVCILEKHSKPGGCLQTFRLQGESFDTGMHYIGGMLPGQPLYRYWQYLDLVRDLDIERLNTDCFDRICFQEKDYPMSQGFDHFRDSLLQFFPGKKEALDRYIRALGDAVSSFPMYLLEMPDDRSEEPYLSMSAFEFYRSLDSSSLLPEVLAGNNFLYAGNPGKTPFYIPALINHSFISGAFRLAGGSDQLVKVLCDRIVNSGGTILPNHEVTRITKEPDIFSVSTGDGEEYQARIMIPDIHPAQFIRIAEPGLFTRAFRDRISSLENTVSSFSLYLVLKPGSFPYLDHNVHYFDTENAWTAGSATGDDWPRYYMLYTPGPGKDTGFASRMIIMTPMRSEETSEWNDTRVSNRGIRYEEFKQAHSEKLMELVGKRFPGLKGSVLAMDAATPLTWRDYTGTPGGSMYGIEKDYHDPVRSMILPRTKVRGLYFTGQNTNIHGALGVTIGAYMTCGEILGTEYLINKVKDAK